jgi:hypothetical protein
MQELFRKLIQPESSLPNNGEEGIRKVCLGKYAFVTAYHLVTSQHVTCGIMALPDESFPATMTIALSKNNPYKGIINYK